MAILLTLGSVLVVSLISFIGVATLSLGEKRIREWLFLLVSLAVGALFGDALIHLIPESFELWGNEPTIPALGILIGILIFFALEKFIHWHHNHISNALNPHIHIHPAGYLIVVGDAVHNFLDGVLIASAFLINIPIGLATAFAVILHEIPQEIGDFGVLLKSGFTTKKALKVNFFSACMAIMGAAIILIFNQQIVDFSQYILPISAGGFIYIAGADLIPELHKEESPSRSFIQILVMSIGMVSMWFLTLLE